MISTISLTWKNIYKLIFSIAYKHNIRGCIVIRYLVLVRDCKSIGTF